MPSTSQDHHDLFADVATLRRTLEPELARYPSRSIGDSFIVLLSGLPGTGKSHFAQELSRRLPFVTVGSDRMRKALVGGRPRYNRGEHARVFAACHRLMEELLRDGYRVVFDATNLTEGFRKEVNEIALRTNSPMLVVWFTAPRHVVRQRLDDRSANRRDDSYSDADWEIYCRLRPGAERIQRPHLEVDSSQDITPVLEEVIKLVNRPAV